MAQELTTDNYHALLNDIRTTLTESLQRIQRTVNTEKVKAYWATGQLINAYLQRLSFSDGDASLFYSRLSRDLRTDRRRLMEAERLYRLYPSLPEDPLQWTHYRTLIQIPDKSRRQYWRERIIRDDLNSKQFRVMLWEERRRQKKGALSGVKLNREDGELFLYRIVLREGTPVPGTDVPGSRLMIDCGFKNYREAASVEAPYLQSGDIIRSARTGIGYEITTVDDPKSVRPKLYTYKACVRRVVDGDTLEVSVDVGFDMWHEETVRLRGIDAYERKTEPGEKAREFVRERLSRVPYIVLKTYKQEKYGRFLGDVIYGENHFLNQELLDEGLARPYQ